MKPFSKWHEHRWVQFYLCLSSRIRRQIMSGHKCERWLNRKELWFLIGTRVKRRRAMSLTWTSMLHFEHVDPKNQSARADERYNIDRRSPRVTNGDARVIRISICRRTRRCRRANTCGRSTATRSKRALDCQHITVTAQGKGQGDAISWCDQCIPGWIICIARVSRETETLANQAHGIR